MADSGERKTTCDAIFCPALRDWETGRRQEMSPETAKLEAATAVFEAKIAGILEAIKHKRRRGQDTAGEERELESLVGQAPVPPLIPRLLYADATPETLAHALAAAWPSGGVLSAEAGAVFGAHGMGQDTILRNLALLNVLWDGGEMAIERRSKIRAAACIVGWHLNEGRRLLADLDTPPSLGAAIRLDAWLRNEAIANDTDRVPTKRIYQYGPNCVRDSRDLRAALAILAERGRARMEETGRRRSVAINPALLDGRE